MKVIGQRMNYRGVYSLVGESTKTRSASDVSVKLSPANGAMDNADKLVAAAKSMKVIIIIGDAIIMPIPGAPIQIKDPKYAGATNLQKKAYLNTLLNGPSYNNGDDKNWALQVIDGIRASGVRKLKSINMDDLIRDLNKERFFRQTDKAEKTRILKKVLNSEKQVAKGGPLSADPPVRQENVVKVRKLYHKDAKPAVTPMKQYSLQEYLPEDKADRVPGILRDGIKSEAESQELGFRPGFYDAALRHFARGGKADKVLDHNSIKMTLRVLDKHCQVFDRQPKQALQDDIFAESDYDKVITLAGGVRSFLKDIGITERSSYSELLQVIGDKYCKSAMRTYFELGLGEGSPEIEEMGDKFDRICMRLAALTLISRLDNWHDPNAQKRFNVTETTLPLYRNIIERFSFVFYAKLGRSEHEVPYEGDVKEGYLYAVNPIDVNEFKCGGAMKKVTERDGSSEFRRMGPNYTRATNELFLMVKGMDDGYKDENGSYTFKEFVNRLSKKQHPLARFSSQAMMLQHLRRQLDQLENGKEADEDK